MPNWFPLSRSWVNAIALILLMAGFQHLSSYLWWIVSWLIALFPRLVYVFYILVTFSPILLIAFIHHWSHQLLDQFFPESRLSSRDRVQGTFPNILSWWQGLYGWSVNYLSKILSWAILGVFLPVPTQGSVLQFSPWNLSNSFKQAHPWFIALLVIQIIFAAFFYQFEYAVQRHLRDGE
ncbi:hypothetical protein K9N68_11435 [Kovacikia minuta CCNUW1]|uniref:hypothetical protein n=1 Tax=Kovacikia minuta TaxID=2931930 RepID=UPI001CCD5C86|nr:hypothetical protein [Kovacikia minuta]UBF28423.1 hypothetical protein K9N68_11435 [Kovacikia minuta CCNUW1]